MRESDGWEMEIGQKENVEGLSNGEGAQEEPSAQGRGQSWAPISRSKAI